MSRQPQKIIPFHQQGFTLLEVMVSLSLMVVLFSLLYGGFRFGYQSWDTARENNVRLSEYQSTNGIVRKWLSRLYPAPLNDSIQDGKGYAFSGTGTRISFTAFMPSYPGRGGLYEVVLSLEQSSTISGFVNLTLNRRFFNADVHRTEPFDPDQKVILLEDAQGAYFEFFGRISGDVTHSWHSDWAELHGLPALIRLRFASTDQSRKNWPDLIIPVMVNHDSICIFPRPENRSFCDAVRQTQEIEKTQ